MNTTTTPAPTADATDTVGAAVALLRARYCGTEAAQLPGLDRRDPRHWMIVTAPLKDAEGWLVRFLCKTRFDPATGCLLWTGAMSHNGYPEFRLGRAVTRASRLSCLTWVDDLTPQHDARHLCDTPRCVNPRHLVPGTRAQNMADMRERGRRQPPSVPMTADEKRALVALYAMRDRLPGLTQAFLADWFGVSPFTVVAVLRAARNAA